MNWGRCSPVSNQLWSSSGLIDNNMSEKMNVIGQFGSDVHQYPISYGLTVASQTTNKSEKMKVIGQFGLDAHQAPISCGLRVMS